MPEPAIGIDLGTSTSIVSVIKDGRPFSIPDPITKSPIVPSIVAINRRGELVVGEKAREEAPSRKIREAKRDMGTAAQYTLGEHTLRPEEVGALVLRKMKDIAEGYLGQGVKKAVVTVPAYFTDIERQATMSAAKLAGLEVIRLINEPTAAAMAFGINHLEADERVLVFDFGGGTLDVTILEMMSGILDVKASHGDKFLGGSDIDQLMTELTQAEFRKTNVHAQLPENSESILKNPAEDAKKELSGAFTADIHIQNFAQASGEEVDLDVVVHREAFNETIEPIIARCIKIIDETLAKAKLHASDIDKVLLVGGSTYIPKVSESVLKHLGKPKIIGVDADLAVSQGAAISAGLALGQIDELSGPIVQDVATHGLGIAVIEQIGHQFMDTYSELIAPGTPVPYMTKKQYTLLRPDQDIMELDVRQDPTGKAVLAAETISTTIRGKIKDIPPAMYGTPHRVEVEFSYDQNHTVQLTATIIGIGKSCTLEFNDRDDILGASGFSNALASVDALWESSPLATRHTSIIKRAEAVLAERPANAERIEAALVDLKSKIAGNDADGAQDARERLTESLADL